MEQAPLFERLYKIEEEQKELKLTIYSLIKTLIRKGAIDEDSIKEAMIAVAKVLDEHEAENLAESNESDLKPDDLELAFRRECAENGIPQPSSKEFREEFQQELKRREAAPAHHYHFVHRTLRNAFYEGQEAFILALADSDNDPATLENLWQTTCDACEETGKPDFGAEDIKIIPCTISGFPAIITVMPPPEHMCEAYMAAMVLLVPVNDLRSMLPNTPEMVFIAIERSHFEIPVVGAWTGKRRQFVGFTRNLTSQEVTDNPSHLIDIVSELLQDSREQLAWKPLAGTV